jgi:hypothetical protein
MAGNPFSAGKIAIMVDRVRATTRQQIIDLTREKTAANQAAIAQTLGHPAPTELFVDGQLGKALEQVEAGGYTLTEFELLGNVVDAALQALFEASPVGPDKDGHYRDDHWLYVNGQRRDAAAEGAAVEIGPTDEVVIINMRPYARKIEGGARERFRRRMTNRRPGLSVQAPNGVYEVTARALKQRFGNIATIRFAYRGVMGGAPVSQTGPTPIKRNARGRFVESGGTRAHNVSSNRFPALEISGVA